jgi:hypothetical protein
VLAALEPIDAELQPGWRVWTQVSLGEVLDGSTVEAFNTINAKRVDFCWSTPTSARGWRSNIRGRGTTRARRPRATRSSARRCGGRVWAMAGVCERRARGAGAGGGAGDGWRRGAADVWS